MYAEISAGKLGFFQLSDNLQRLSTRSSRCRQAGFAQHITIVRYFVRELRMPLARACMILEGC